MDPRAFVYMALSGEQLHGPSSGVVFVDSETHHAKYTLLNELEPANVREALRDSVQSHTEDLFIVQRTSTHLHVFRHAREKAKEQLSRGELPTLEPA